MLASLLPGLRDVRTPLTVGYLWLTISWIWFRGFIPARAPTQDGFLRRLFDLSAFVGSAATLAALSFLAYLLGALLTIPTEGRLGNVLSRATPLTPGAKQTRDEYVDLLATAASQLGTRIRSGDLPPGKDSYDYERLQIEAFWAEREDDEPENWQAAQQKLAQVNDDLRPRLLVQNAELYGEYDRLAAESAFRINVCPPLAALATTAALQLWWGWALVGALAVGVLFLQGVGRASRSASVLRRAVISGEIEHPIQSALREIAESPPRPIA